MELDDGAKRATVQALGFSGQANIRDIDDFLRAVKKDITPKVAKASVAQPIIKKEIAKPEKLPIEVTIRKVKASAKKEIKPVVKTPTKQVMSEAVWNVMPVPERVKLAQSKNLPGTVGSAEWSHIPPSIQGTITGITQYAGKVKMPEVKVEPEAKAEEVPAKSPEAKVKKPRVRKEVIQEVKPVVPKEPTSKPRLSNDVVANLRALRFTDKDIALIQTEEQARRILDLKTKPSTESLQSFMKKEAKVRKVESKPVEKPKPKVVIPKEKGGERVDDIILKRVEKPVPKEALKKLQVGWKKTPVKKEERIIAPVPQIVQAEPAVKPVVKPVEPEKPKPTVSDILPYVEPTKAVSRKRVKPPKSIPKTPAEILGLPPKVVETKVQKEPKPLSYSERLRKMEREHLTEVRKQQKAETKRQRLLPVLWKPKPQPQPGTKPMPMPPSSQRLLAPPVSIREKIKEKVAEREAQEREREADAAAREAELKKKAVYQKRISQAEFKQLALVTKQQKSAEAKEEKRKEKISRYLRGFGIYSEGLLNSARTQGELDAIQRERARRKQVKEEARIEKAGGRKYVTAKEKHARYKRKERMKKWRVEETTPGFARRRKGKGKRIGTSPLGNVIQKVLYPVHPKKRGRW
jgi:hypothetical protein